MELIGWIFFILNRKFRDKIIGAKLLRAARAVQAKMFYQKIHQWYLHSTKHSSHKARNGIE
jgi:hypothetical protein